MLKNIVRLESVVGSRVGHFLIDNDIPVHIAKEMCHQFISYLQQIEDNAKAQQASKPEVEEVIEPQAE